MTYVISYTRDVEKSLKKLNKGLQKKIIRKVELLADNPRPNGVKRLVGRHEWRIRVGDYRVIYEINDKVVTILVVRVAHRKDVYR